MHYILAIDQGTHASRALLFDQLGQAVASHWCDVKLLRPTPGRVEQDPAELLASVQRAVNQLLAALDKKQRKAISACGICTQRSTVVACSRGGQALSQALSWQDVRGTDFLKTLQEHSADIQRLSGLPVSAHYGASKLRWLAQYTDNSQADDFCLAPLVSYILLNLLTEKPYAVDHSNAQRTQLMDMANLRWSAPLLDWFGITANQLPAIQPMYHPYGHLRDTDIPVTAVCGDQNAAVFGAGELPADTALANLGSGAFILRRLTTAAPSQHQLSGIACSDSSRVDYLREGTVNGAGTALSWASEQYELGDLKPVLGDWLDKVLEPPVFINTVGGLGSPWWQSNVAPQWIGETPEDKADIAVAVTESIIFLLQDNLQLMQQEHPVKKIRISGGLSQLDGLCQRLASLSGLIVERLNNPEATARGVAWLAAGRPEHWQQPAREIFSPRQDAGLTKRYRQFCERLAELLKE